MKRLLGEKVYITGEMYELLRRSDLEKRKRIVKSCFSKKRFNDMGEVADALSYLFDKLGDYYKFYKCKYCKGYHLTRGKLKKK